MVALVMDSVPPRMALTSASVFWAGQVQIAVYLWNKVVMMILIMITVSKKTFFVLKNLFLRILA